MTDPVLLEVRDLQTHFGPVDAPVPAVNGVSFSLARGKVLGLVGESGSGKSVTGFSIMRLIDKPGRLPEERSCSMALISRGSASTRCESYAVGASP